MKRIWVRLAPLAVAFLGLAAPAAADCNAVRAAVQEAKLPAHPFGILTSRDGCHLFVTLNAGRAGGAVLALKRNDGALAVGGALKADAPLFGIALTHDETLLLAATDDGVAFYDTAKLIANGQDAKLGHFDTDGRGAIYVAVSRDDRLAFVSNERSQTIAVIDLAKARATGFSDDDAVIGTIPVGKNPVGLAFSPDGKTLYATSQEMWGFDWPGECKSERKARVSLSEDAGRAKEGRISAHADQEMEVELQSTHREGALFAIDVTKAASDPGHAVLAKLPAGCNPVRVVTSPDGARLYVSARGEGTLLVFDAAKLHDEAKSAEVARIAVGLSPVGVAATADGRIVVTNSDRFDVKASAAPKSVSVIDAATLKPVGTVPVGGFPREVAVTADGQVLLVANFGSNSITLLDLRRLPMAAASTP